jgi:hypothetical protein
MAQDSALSRALARQEALRREIEDRQEEIREIDTFISLYRRFADDSPPNQQEVAETPQNARRRVRLDDDNNQPDVGRPQTKRSGLTQREFERIGRELLLARGRPAQRRAFLDLFRERDIVIGGADELKNLGTKIWMARAVLTNIRGEGYWPADVPCPAVGYFPRQEASGEGQQEFTDMDSAA